MKAMRNFRRALTKLSDGYKLDLGRILFAQGQRLESLPNLVYLDTRLMVPNHDSRATVRPDNHEALAFESSLSFTNR
jgi:hypothetical protein